MHLNAPLRRGSLPPRQKHKTSPGIKVWTDASGTTVTKAEFNLPTVLFGSNGRLITNQHELNEALEKCALALGEMAAVPPIDSWRAGRVDIVWNFALDAATLIMAHSYLRLRGIGTLPSLIRGGQGLSWRGVKSTFVVTFYDKGRKSGAGSSVLRVEVRVCAEKLRRRLPGAAWYQCAELWRVYRSIITSLPVIPAPKAAANWQEAVGLHAPPEVQAKILACFAHRPARTYRRYCQKVSAAAAKLPDTFSWTDLLPVAAPPAAVHVAARKLRSG